MILPPMENFAFGWKKSADAHDHFHTFRNDIFCEISEWTLWSMAKSILGAEKLICMYVCIYKPQIFVRQGVYCGLRLA